MKKILLLCTAMALFVTSAFAAGVDLTVVACPGGTGETQSATLDCTGASGPVTLLVSFEPNEAITDLVAADMLMDLGITGGDLGSSANFWDFAVANTGGLSVSRLRPSVGCSAFTNAWSVAGSGEGSGALIKSPTAERVAMSVFRPSNLSVAAGQKIFGIQATIDPTTAVEAGGSGVGCSMPVNLVLNQLNPGSAGGAPTTPLTSGALVGNCVSVNGGNNCAAVPTSRHTWGQLKSLYR